MSVVRFTPLADCGAFVGYQDVAALRVGWVVRTHHENNLFYGWTFASKHASGRGIVIAFPSSDQEWGGLQAVLNEAGIHIPETVREDARKAIHNANKRYMSSFEPGAPTDGYGIHGLLLPPIPFQISGVKYAEEMGWRAVIGDDMGLGKTIQGLGCALNTQAKRIVVVTRSIAVEGWGKAIKKFTDYPVLTASGVKEIKSTRKDGSLKMPEGEIALNFGIDQLHEQQGFLVIHYNILHAWGDEILRYKPDLFLLDEIHAVKNPEARCSKTAYHIIENVEKAVGLSGTLMPNRPKELYHVLNAIQPGKWGDFFSYAKRYCDAKQVVVSREWRVTKEKRTCTPCGGKGCAKCGKTGQVAVKECIEKKAWDFDGASNSMELHQRLRSTGVVRRLKKDVLSSLPKTQETFSIPASKRYREVEKGVLLAIGDGVFEGVVFDPGNNKKHEASMHELFRAAVEDKIEWMKEWLDAFLQDTDEKLVVTFHHQRVGDEAAKWLTENGYGFVPMYGSNPDRKGEGKFQEDPNIRVALCSYAVSREAITLTASSYMLCMEYAWTPSWMEQMMDRIDRYGQERGCNYYFPLLENSVEYRLVSAMLEKQDISSVIMEGKHIRTIEVDLGKSGVKKPAAARKSSVAPAMV